MHKTTALLTGVLLSSGCAFTDIRLTLPKEPLENTISGGNGREVIVANAFADERTIRERCGMQKNGYNMDTAAAVCQSDPNAWIATLLADELRASGFSVLGADSDRRPSALQIDGSLLKIFVEPVLGAWTSSLEADLSVKLRATSETGLAAERTFFVKGWKGGQLASTSQPYHTALHRATQALLEEMVRAIVELMNEFPQLGSAEGAELRLAFLVAEVQR
jgi:hypothetical protein